MGTENIIATQGSSFREQKATILSGLVAAVILHVVDAAPDCAMDIRTLVGLFHVRFKSPFMRYEEFVRYEE